jgi:hypothetical protein
MHGIYDVTRLAIPTVLKEFRVFCCAYTQLGKYIRSTARPKNKSPILTPRDTDISGIAFSVVSRNCLHVPSAQTRYVVDMLAGLRHHP